MIGLYVHIPFCHGKCPYCDFYSVRADKQKMDMYHKALLREFKLRSGVKTADTLYIGGGTPSLLEVSQIASIVDSAKGLYNLSNGCEVTVECNPCTLTKEKLSGLKAAGINRLSIGVQSGVDCELKAIGRKHNLKTAQQAIDFAREVGFNNISIDIMIGIPGQTKESLKKTLLFIKKADIDHCSFYQMKIEPNTPFGINPPKVPCDDETAELYLFAVKNLEEMGFKQYEISNFAKDKKQCKHNLKYWHRQEYLGFGASAHSFLDGKRFYHKRDIYKYMNDVSFVKYEKSTNSVFEWLMLKFRLNSGITKDELQKNGILNDELECRIAKLQDAGFLNMKDDIISLTPKGMLVQNAILLNLFHKL